MSNDKGMSKPKAQELIQKILDSGILVLFEIWTLDFIWHLDFDIWNFF